MLKRVLSVCAGIVVALCMLCTPIFGNKPVVIVSGSMEPAIMTNALTIVHKCKVASIEVGDIITYYHPVLDELVTHRVVQKSNGACLTKGDANVAADDVLVTDENIFGKNFLVMNFLAPIIAPLVQDEQYNKLQAIAVLVMFLLYAGALVVVVSFIIYSGMAWRSVILSEPFSEEELEDMDATLQQLKMGCAERDSMSIWKRYKLTMAYNTCRRQLRDIKDELNKL